MKPRILCVRRCHPILTRPRQPAPRLYRHAHTLHLTYSIRIRQYVAFVLKASGLRPYAQGFLIMPQLMDLESQPSIRQRRRDVSTSFQIIETLLLRVRIHLSNHDEVSHVVLFGTEHACLKISSHHRPLTNFREAISFTFLKILPLP